MEPLQPGDPTAVGRYRLGGRLGHGGMGQVFWARSPSGRPVAVKIVHAHLATQPDFRRRFAHEVDAARRVGGFHTASVVDADPTGDPPWLVTAYVAGPSLSAALQRTGPFTLPTLRILGAGLAEALEAVHAAGLVHRDLKPANIILAEDGPRVIDFGIARALDPAEAAGLTATGAAIGTPRFMAPEQFGDQPITGAADVFAWGTVMCHAAGTHPFGDGAAATLVGAILTRPPNLDGVPAPLVDLVAACLDKDPARRPTPAQLLDTLSDGSSSEGWLPGPVRAMLPEHTLPDVTAPADRRQAAPAGGAPTVTGPTEAARTQVLQDRPGHRATPPLPRPAAIAPGQAAAHTVRIPAGPPPPSSTQRFGGPPPFPPPEPADGPRAARSRRFAIVIAASATVVIVGAVAAAVLLAGSRGEQQPPAAAPAATSSAAASTTDPTPSSDPSAEARFAGNWQTVDGSAADIAMRFAPGEEGGSIYDVGITVVGSADCAGQDATAESKASAADTVLAVSWVLTCGGSGQTSTLDEQYTYDPGSDMLTDSTGLTYYRIT